MLIGGGKLTFVPPFCLWRLPRLFPQLAKVVKMRGSAMAGKYALEGLQSSVERAPQYFEFRAALLCRSLLTRGWESPGDPPEEGEGLEVGAAHHPRTCTELQEDFQKSVNLLSLPEHSPPFRLPLLRLPAIRHLYSPRSLQTETCLYGALARRSGTVRKITWPLPCQTTFWHAEGMK